MNLYRELLGKKFQCYRATEREESVGNKRRAMSDSMLRDQRGGSSRLQTCTRFFGSGNMRADVSKKWGKDLQRRRGSVRLSMPFDIPLA